MNVQVTATQPMSSLQQASLLQQMISPGDVILELGSFASCTTQALLSRRCRCYVEDLPEFLNEMQIHDDFDFESALRQHLGVVEDDVKIDVILTWDLFHYLDLTEIKILFKVLGNKIGSGTVIHLIRYTNRDIPERPQQFKLSNDLSYQMIEKKSLEKIANHSHATIDLLKELKYFNLNDRLTHSVSSNKGLVEYSLVYSEEARKPTPVRPFSFDAIQPDAESKFEQIKLPNLKKYLVESSKEKTGCILDCGGSSVSNYEQLSHCSKFVLEEDIHASIVWKKKITAAANYISDDQLLNYRESVNFNLVLMWDRVNYCEAAQFTDLIRKLTAHFSFNSLLHFVLPYSGFTTASPANFKIDDQFNVGFSGNLSGETKLKVISTGQLVRLLPGFKVLAYYFGTQENGQNYQEYLFQYTG